MGRKKIDTSNYMQDEGCRDILYSKRKRNLLKQCMELSIICGQEICLTIFDKSKQKIVQYCSNNNFTPAMAQQLLEPENVSMLSCQALNNDHFDKIWEGRANTKVKLADLHPCDIMQSGKNKTDITKNDDGESSLQSKSKQLPFNPNPDLREFLKPENFKKYRKKAAFRFEKRKEKIFRKELLKYDRGIKRS